MLFGRRYRECANALMQLCRLGLSGRKVAFVSTALVKTHLAPFLVQSASKKEYSITKKIDGLYIQYHLKCADALLQFESFCLTINEFG